MSTFPEIFSLLSQLFRSGLFCPFAEVFRSFARHVAPIAVAGVWQGAVVAAGLALCLRLAPRVAAAHRFAAWAAAFGVLMALPLTPALVAVLHPASGSGLGDSASLPQSAHPLFALDNRWSLAIAALWVFVALARAIVLGLQARRLRQLWKNATPIGLPTAFSFKGGNGAGERQTRFEFCTTRELDRPIVIGFFAPRILIPEWLMGRLTAQELEQVVLHEAEHLRRRDDWTNLLQKLCLVVFPLNPALMWMERRLCGEREMACDEGVVRRTQAPRAYAACLAGLAERVIERRAQALSLGAFERRPELARRVHSILLRRGALNPVASGALLAALGCALTVGGIALARCPQLVAFVPAQRAVQTARLEPAALATDRPGTDQLLSQSGAMNMRDGNTPITNARAIHTMAEMKGPTRRGNETPGMSSANGRGVGLLQTAINAARAINVSSTEVATDSARSGVPMPQELIVLTAYERVQDAGDESGDRVISDSSADSAAGAKPGSEPTGQYTVTRLVFRVIPAAAQEQEADQPRTAGSPATPADTARSTAPAARTGSEQKPPAHQPQPIPLGNGWFVIQL